MSDRIEPEAPRSWLDDPREERAPEDEIAKWKKLLRTTAGDAAKAISERDEELAALRSENARLRAALEPFERLACAAEEQFSDCDPPMPDTTRLYSLGNGVVNAAWLTLGHLRAASQALKEKTDGE